MHDPAPSAPVRALRPRKGSFLFPRLWPAALAFGALGAAAGGGLAVAGLPVVACAAAGVLVLAAGLGFSLWAALVAYGKESYELHPSHVVCRRGGLLSDQTTELEAKNVTHVQLRRPWLRHLLFGVGDVTIESAGSGDSEVVLRSIVDPEPVYAEVRALMQRNGFALQQDALLHEERPDLVGVLVECLGLAGAAVFGLGLFAAEVLVDAKLDRAEGPLRALLLAGGALFAAAGVAALAFHFLDLRRRVYRVFADAVVYHEGFLTRVDAFIPGENVADADTKRTFVDQVLGLYDVQVSCQGSGQEIKFRRLRRGPDLARAIDRVVQHGAAGRARLRAGDAADAGDAPSAAGEGAEDAAPTGAQDAPGGLPARRPRPVVAPEDAWQAELRMHMPRVVVPLLPLLPLLPVWLLATVQAVLTAAATRYSVRRNTIRSAYKLLSTSEREFAYDKVTGLVLVESPWDWLFKTCTVRLWSIGAPRPIELQHVRRDEVFLPGLLAQLGIPRAGGPCWEAEAAFGPGAWLRSNPFGFALVALALAGLAVAGTAAHPAFFFVAVGVLAAVAARFVWCRELYARQRLVVYEHHVEARTGILLQERFFVRHDHVKRVHLTRYPGGDVGQVRLLVAGEQRVQTQKGAADDAAKGGIVVPYGFTVKFLAGAATHRCLLDDLLTGRVPAAPDAAPGAPLAVLRESQPVVGAAVARLVGLSLLAFPLLPFLPLTLPLTVAAVRRRRFRVEAGRVVVTWGLVFDHQESVPFDRIDTLRHERGPLGKLFGAGNVVLLTAGSSTADMVLGDAPDFEALYALIRRHYAKGGDLGAK